MATRNIKQSNFAHGANRGLVGPYYNFKPSNVGKIQTAMQRTDRNCNILVYGPSTTRGQSTPNASQAINSWVMQAAVKMRLLGIAAGANNFFGDAGNWGNAQTIANTLAGDGRLAITGAMTLGPIKVAGGNYFQVSAAGGLQFLPQDGITKFEVFSRDSAVGRNFNASVDGGAATAINSGAVTKIVKTLVSAGALGAHTLSMDWALGGVGIIGANSYDDTNGRREVSLLNFGISGARSDQLIDNSDVAGRTAMITFLGLDANGGAPGMILDDWPINDWRQSIDIAVTKANIITGANLAIAAGIQPILTTPPYDGGVSGLTAQQDAYAAMAFDVADQLDIPVWDCRVADVSYAVANAQLKNYDTVHKAALGYAVKAAGCAEMFHMIRSM